MTDSPQRALKEAEAWLASAKLTLADTRRGTGLPDASVCCAEAIHAIIRANDALSLRFFGTKATRHDDAAIVFAKLIREGKLADGAERFKETIANAMRDKSGADYGKGEFTAKDAERYVAEAEGFIELVRKMFG